MSKRQIGVNQGLKLFFGFFMVLFYLFVAVLMAINAFNFINTPFWTGVRWFFAVILALYGIYRGYREFKGEHTYGMRIDDSRSDENEYTSYTERLKRFEQNPDNDEKNQ
ncbi:MAG: hypothetical protein IJK41_10075 [Muribaculaceae bacterium]|nr:hypothetical protein [Muribaculaceae bacterium]